MCGIAGYWASEPGLRGVAAQNTLRAMASALVHRGPDAEGIWRDDEAGVGFAHRRLSILDLSPAGTQPMQSASGRFVIIYNGEIYNHLSIRSELEERKAVPEWLGHSDTETLLAAIEQWGLEETLKRAYGMFALALWDRKKKELLLARDRIGEKPLYWGWSGSSLVFGSELKAITAYPNFARAVCRGALVQYLRFAYVPAPRSIYAGIYKLEPGSIVRVVGQPPKIPPAKPLRPGQTYENISVSRYWSLNATVEDGARVPLQDESEAVEELTRVLGSAVQRQMISDVPLGAFLSGGIDSSTIVALMQQRSDRPVKTFTIGFDEAAYDESPYADAVARHLGTDHTALRVTAAETRAVIPDLNMLYDEPFADSSQIPTHLVCRVARQQVTVALSGDGGDELFGGYNRYILGPQIWNRISWLPFPVRRAFAAGILAMPTNIWDRFGAVYNQIRPASLGIASLGDKAHRVAHRLRKISSIDDLHKNMTSLWVDPSDLVIGRSDAGEPASMLDDPLPIHGTKDPAERMMLQDLRTYLPDDILCKVDRAAMGISLETRVPFLDPEVVQLAARLPLSMKIRDGSGKWALRQVLYKQVPRSIIDRPKAGFGIPIGDWLRGPLRNWADDLLAPDTLARSGLIDPDPVAAAWAEHRSGRRDWTHQLWIILMLQSWLEAEANR